MTAYSLQQLVLEMSLLILKSLVIVLPSEQELLLMVLPKASDFVQPVSGHLKSKEPAKPWVVATREGQIYSKI